MGLDIIIKELKEFRCPDCGQLVTTQNIDAECSSGRVWYDFLESVGYYVEGDNLAGWPVGKALTEPVRQRTRGYRPSAKMDLEG